MPNGQSYRFAGIIDSVRTPSGDNVSVNNEGTVRDSNQTTKTVTRAGIGAALGALVGAIAGGGQGAAVGAATTNSVGGAVVGGVLGAVGGAIAGTAIDQNTSRRGIEVTVQRDDGQRVTIAQVDDGDVQMGDRVIIVYDRNGVAKVVRDTGYRRD